MKQEIDILGFDPTQLSVFASDNSIEEEFDETSLNYAIKTIKTWEHTGTNVYFAGKIEADGWRQNFIDIRNNFIAGENHPLIDEVVPMKIEDADFLVTGPFFLACDHRCAHGEGSHGLGRHQEGCIEACGEVRSGREISNICKEQIKRADIVFAYIYDDTCFGSLFEIGYAKALGKRIITVFDTCKREDDMWFIAKNTDYSISLDVYDLKNTKPALYKRLTHSLNNYYDPIEFIAECFIERLRGKK